jgi:hypothetical protein
MDFFTDPRRAADSDRMYNAPALQAAVSVIYTVLPLI